MSNNKDKIIYESITHSGWLSKQPIRIFNIATSGRGDGAGRAWVYDGDVQNGKLIIHIISANWYTQQLHFPDGIPVKRGCYVKISDTTPLVVIGFKYE